MGQDVGRTTFSRRDRQQYRAKVQQCLDVLATMLREHPFARDEPMTGVEVELNLVSDTRPRARRTRPPRCWRRSGPASSSPSWAAGTSS